LSCVVRHRRASARDGTPRRAELARSAGLDRPAATGRSRASSNRRKPARTRYRDTSGPPDRERCRYCRTRRTSSNTFGPPPRRPPRRAYGAHPVRGTTRAAIQKPAVGRRERPERAGQAMIEHGDGARQRRGTPRGLRGRTARPGAAGRDGSVRSPARNGHHGTPAAMAGRRGRAIRALLAGRGFRPSRDDLHDFAAPHRRAPRAHAEGRTRGGSRRRRHERDHARFAGSRDGSLVEERRVVPFGIFGLDVFFLLDADSRSYEPRTVSVWRVWTLSTTRGSSRRRSMSCESDRWLFQPFSPKASQQVSVRFGFRRCAARGGGTTRVIQRCVIAPRAG